MASAKNLGQQYAKEQKIKLILEILGAVFALLPLVDEFLPEVGDWDGVAEIAAKRRALKDTDISKIGADFKKETDEFEETVGPRCEI